MDIFVPEKVREGYEVFHTFIDNNLEAIRNGQELLLEVTDLDTLGKLVVKAVVKGEVEDTAGWSDLWVRDKEDKIVPRPWKIKILEELDPEEVEVKRPGFENEEGSGLYGSVLTTKKMEQDAIMFKKQFGRKKLEQKEG